MRRVLGIVLALVMLVVPGALGCAPKTDVMEETKAGGEAGPISVVDLAGRTVEVPAVATRVVAIGPGALRLACYAGAADKVVGIEEFETRQPMGRPYMIANPELLKLPMVGVGGPDSTPDAERLIGVDPDVVFVAQLVDKDAADELQAATGVPVIVLSYGELGTFTAEAARSIEIVGKVVGTEQRAAEVVAFIEDTLADLSKRTAEIADAQKPTVYVGGLGFKGPRGIESSQGEYPPFAAIGAKSVTAELGQKGSVMIDKEKLITWDPDYIFVDRGGLGLVKEDVSANRAFYEQLSAVKNGKVHALIPFNFYWTNIELALANAYYAGKVMFPDAFADVDPAKKADEISTAMLGAPVYDKIVEASGGGFGAIDLLGGKQ